MKPSSCGFAATVLLVGMSAVDTTFAQKPSGTLRLYSPDSPASMSIHEEITVLPKGR
jgi:hypothetical protein